VKFLYLAVLFLIFNATVVNAITYNNTTCGIASPEPLRNAYGPYDYTNPSHQSRLPIVIGAHFKKSVQRLTPGTNHSGDLSYTLRAIPNYHPALYAISQYEQQNKLLHHKSYTADCFFRRAIYFQPKDSTSQMLFAMHLQATKRMKLARQYYESALKISPTAAELNYNYGLFMVGQGHIKQARKAAKIAYKMGYPLQGLKKKLANYNKSNK